MTAIQCGEVELLRRLYEESEDGNGRLVLVNGGLGVGKTDLLREVSRLAADSGALVMRASGSRAEQMLRGGVIEQLVYSTGLPQDIADQMDKVMAADTFRESTDAADGQASGVRREEAQVLRRLAGILLGLARRQPLVIAVDDIQFADYTSLNFLLWLQRRMESARILVVLSEWERPHDVLPAFSAELTRLPHHRIHLAPLTAERVAEVLGTALGGPVPDHLARSYHLASGGNSVLLKALIEDRRDGFAEADGDLDGEFGGELGEEPPSGPAFARALMSCLHAWDTNLLRVAQCLVLLGDEVAPSIVARVLGLESRSVTQAMDILTDAGLISAGRLRSRAAEAAVLASLPVDEHTRLRLQIAELLYERGASSDVIAGHLAAADRSAGAWSAGVLREAGEKALAEDKAPLAVRYLELALGAETGEQERAAIIEALVRANWRFNPSAAMVHSGPLRQAMRDGRLAAAEMVTLIRQAMWQGDTAVVEQGLTLLRDPDSQADLTTRAVVRLATLWFYGPSAQLDLTGTGPDTPLGEDPWTRAASALADAWTQGSTEATVASAEHILQSCALSDNSLEVLATALLALGQGSKAEKAAALCDELIEEAARRGAPTWQALLGVVRADIALRRGELATAISHADTALATLPAQNWGVLIGYPLAVLVRGNTAMGRHGVAARALRHVLPDGLFSTVLGLRYLHARGAYHLATEQVLASLNDFETCAELQRQWNLDLNVLMPVRTDLAEANLRLGRRRMARQLARQELECSKPGDAATRGRAMRVLAGCSELSQRQGLLVDAVGLLETAGDRFEHARTLAELSEVYQELGEFERARETSRRAAQETKACRAPAATFVRRRGRSADDLLLQPEPAFETDQTPELSRAERKVAMLAALGHTNRAIGRRLYITVSTVEQHLTRVYRKLGVNGRTDLPAGLAMFDVPDTAVDAEVHLA